MSKNNSVPKYMKTDALGDDVSTFNADLNESMGFLISDTARAVKRSLYARIAQHNIRGGHWYCLRTLLQEDGITQRELSERLRIMGPSTVEMLRAMEKEGLVDRRRDPHDKRKVRVYLTEHARSIQPILLQIASEVNATMVGHMSEAEQVLLKLLLRRLRSTLDEDASTYVADLPSVE
ncbi:MarR family winged helix-turn-helix transcriptional regulator [Pusillimonas sp.]|uniref:MarR family winged helix-turn-helix transcriptional regulator n=1 Tax=Pusillimonas sp. TaxID=3040095 RepID=UPI0029A9ED98|nr:MarR family winged helix-turn-helix transcriptional regulator [Pusillimonas sp.]MDX3893851.1 MarR family winged helix-turn-helix transcriptional regulator [Pusillimonas sp.]